MLFRSARIGVFGRVGGADGLFAGRLDVVTPDAADGRPGVPDFVSGLFAGRLDAVTALCETFIGGFPATELLGRVAGTSTGLGAGFGRTFAAGFGAGFAAAFAAGFGAGLAGAFAAGFGADFGRTFAAGFGAGLAAGLDVAFCLGVDVACGLDVPINREKIPFFSAMCRHKSSEVGDAAAVAPLVVIPGDDLRKGAVQHHGARRVDDRRSRVCAEI